ncbi:hypothetical protein COO60DRAFT_67901 [Scenedesmus sp. NREL 46B-D3]|nr:hypothetical protein COO60DRAFT_67901 [Scenedesmus sp. NREL 46B-D3]
MCQQPRTFRARGLIRVPLLSCRFLFSALHSAPFFRQHRSPCGPLLLSHHTLLCRGSGVRLCSAAGTCWHHASPASPPPPSLPSQRRGLSPAGVKGLVAAILIALGLAGMAAGYLFFCRHSRADGFNQYADGGFFGRATNWWGTGARFRWGSVLPWQWSAAARQRRYQQQVSRWAKLLRRE